MATVSDAAGKEIDTMRFFQFIDTALFSPEGKLMFVAITSSAQGAVETEGWQFGQGKSHLAGFLAREVLYRAYKPPEYAYAKFRGSPELYKWQHNMPEGLAVDGVFTRKDAEEMVKRSCGYHLSDIRRMLKGGRVLTHPTWWQDDWQIVAGKHMSFDKGIRKLAGILSAARPYVRVVFTTQPDLGDIAKCMRDIVMFELKVPERGLTEIQQIKTFTDFGNPLFPYKRLQPLRRGQLDVVDFPKLSPEMSDWYKEWRDVNFNAEVDAWVNEFLDEPEPKREPVDESEASKAGRALVEARWGRKVIDGVTIEI
jgi:hypothetical protein